jgi:cupin 2 domain-containing protein
MLPTQLGNIFERIPRLLEEESFADLLVSGHVRIERIVSHGHASAEGFWYEQEEAEWVIVLQGAARIRFEDRDQLLEMKTGDFINIPARQRHRVEWTTPDSPTVWLAVFYGEDGSSSSC